MLLNNLVNAGLFGTGLYKILQNRNSTPWDDPDNPQANQMNNAQMLAQYNSGITGKPMPVSNMPMNSSMMPSNASASQAPLPTSPDGMPIPSAYIPSINPQVQPQPLSGGGPDINQLRALAMQTYPDNPVMQQVAISQAILESGNPGHMSSLATKNNNLFGIKGSNTAPGTANNVPMNTTEYSNGTPNISRADFSSNANLDDSFNQHKQLLTNLPRYANVLNATTPQKAFSSLQSANYATDPNYAKKLNNVWQNYVQPLYF